LSNSLVGFFELLPDRENKAGSLRWWEVVAGPRKIGGPDWALVGLIRLLTKF